ncbi:MAG: hypothetical protein IT342_03780 [Candidatus Melainabacteria bacterium]|nr:hypothetical protein [Candidatus Melainabacteria bacterium]
MAFGSALGVVSRLGASGRIVAAAVGTAMTIKFVYDELSANRWSKFGGALKDAWQIAIFLSCTQQEMVACTIARRLSDSFESGLPGNISIRSYSAGNAGNQATVLFFSGITGDCSQF